VLGSIDAAFKYYLPENFTGSNARFLIGLNWLAQSLHPGTERNLHQAYTFYLHRMHS
jgi:hypothetical protein